ncbi:diguanylate cyclase [Antribacter sp. KLBMP9083]|uniref:Diguanylate cyclase n=1 Tax=Antribacter soli TaxID=2910976 RepID=A0AA41QI36_9MICO|nr:diguanylate cyclase [Antribacter soli]MCF4123141.1 diguanylate cyclase [Antribacter soli]
MTTATILIADDSLVIRAVVRDGLENEGYRVIEAVDGLDALRQCREDPPDVVLLDVEMPGLDGFQVLTALKGDAELRDIPVVFLTGRNTMNDVVAGLRGGAHDYLRKPFEAAELLARVGAASHIKMLQDQLQQRNAELERLSRTDSLTGLYNRRHLVEELNRRHHDSVRHQYPLCVALLDLDLFKQINDTYGHSAGDQVLHAFAGHLHSELRAGDVAGRWGGEEFLVILPHTDLDGALAVAERIRSATAAEPVSVDGQRITVTVSGGCALGPADSPEAIVHLADVGLYRAKSSGRNQIATAPPSPGAVQMTR